MLRGFLKNVTDRLEEGGVFIGTTVDSDRLVCQIRESGKMNIGNEYYDVIFGQDTFLKKDSPFGIKYYFYLKDAVGQTQFTDNRPKYVPEFLVNFQELEKIAKEFGL